MVKMKTVDVLGFAGVHNTVSTRPYDKTRCMIVSHKHKFIFIKTRKTAGTSIEVFLSAHCGHHDIVTPIRPHVEPHKPRNNEGFYNHMPGHEIRKQIGADKWHEYFKFCVERNPWDKVLSFYHFINKFRHGGQLTLDAFFKAGLFCTDTPQYTEPADENSIIVDRVIRYEKLSSELSEVFRHLNIPFNGSLGVNAKSEFREDRRHYPEVLSEAQVQLITDAFQTEIQLFGYTY